MRRRNFVAGLAAAGFVVSLSPAPLAQSGTRPSFKMLLGRGKSAVSMRVYSADPARGVDILLRDSEGDHWIKLGLNDAALKVMGSAAQARAFTVNTGEISVDVALTLSGEGGTYRFESGGKRLTGSFGVDPEVPQARRGILSIIGNAIGGALSFLGDKLVGLGNGLAWLARGIATLASGNFTVTIDARGESTTVTVTRNEPGSGFMADPSCDSNLVLC